LISFWLLFSDFSILFPIVVIPDSFVEQTEWCVASYIFYARGNRFESSLEHRLFWVRFTWHYFSLQINNTMPCVYKRMLGWFPRLQFATVCFLCSPPDLNFLDPYFIFMYVHNSHCHRETAHLQVNILLLLLLL
jgi:hypothetical protein